MLTFLKRWFAPSVNPIGVDFGDDSLRMAQVSVAGGEPQLIAAASAEVPTHVRHDAASRLTFFSETVRELLTHGGFQGRRAVLGVPSSALHIQHLKLPKMDDEAMKKAIPWEARGKLPVDPARALLRHHVAGEVYSDSEARSEVILMASARETVNQLLAAASRAKLEVAGMNVQPVSLMDCFGHVYRRKTDATAVNLFVDIGWGSTRAVVAQGSHMLFARSIGVGGERLNKAVASALKITPEDAKLLRVRLGLSQPVQDERETRVQLPPAERPPGPTVEAAPAVSAENDFALLRVGQKLSQRNQASNRVGEREPSVAVAEPPRAAPAGAGAKAGDSQLQARLVEQACGQTLAHLVGELDLCRRYYEATFPSKPVERLIFVGGEAHQRGLCQQIAQGLGLAAQVGDPLVRMGRTSQVGIESGLDRRQPQPGWAVAIGLSLGPAEPSQPAGGPE